MLLFCTFTVINTILRMGLELNTGKFFIVQKVDIQVKTGLLIGCYKKSEIMQHFQGGLCT